MSLIAAQISSLSTRTIVRTVSRTIGNVFAPTCCTATPSANNPTSSRHTWLPPLSDYAMAQSLSGGSRVCLDDVGLFADGVAVQQVGAKTFPIVRETVRTIVRVDNDEICAAIKDIFDDTRTIAEPAGALAVAGLKSYVEANGVRGRR